MKTILVVDDFGSVRDLLVRILTSKGYNVLSASDGKEAYSCLEMNIGTVDLVLTDYNMPELTGYELLLKIKANEALMKIPVIFLTSETLPAKMIQAKEAGLEAWIRKPYKAEQFFSTIENILK